MTKNTCIQIFLILSFLTFVRANNLLPYLFLWDLFFLFSVTAEDFLDGAEHVQKELTGVLPDSDDGSEGEQEKELSEEVVEEPDERNVSSEEINDDQKLERQSSPDSSLQDIALYAKEQPESQ